MSVHESKKDLTVPRRPRKIPIAATIFLLVTLSIEALIIWLFLSLGLVDKSAFTLRALSMNVVISPLLHFVPLGVILVLISSWLYLIKKISFIPERAAKKPKPSHAKPKRHGRFYLRIRRKLRRISWFFKGHYHKIRERVLKVRGVSWIIEKISLAKGPIKSALTVILSFLALFSLMLLATNPAILHNLIISVYRGNPSIQNLVLGLMKGANSIAQSTPIIGWIASAINNAILASSPGFWKAFNGAGKSLLGSLSQLDLAGKYTLCQNFGALLSALAALVYGHYISSKYRYKFRRT